MQDRIPSDSSVGATNLLQLSATPGCTEEEIKAAYRGLAQQLHPDHGGDAERFRRLQQDYEVALERLKQPLKKPVVVTPYVPQAPVKRRVRRRPFRRAMIVLIILSLVSLVLPADGRKLLFALLPAVLGMVFVPVLLTAWKPHLSGLLCLVTTPVWIVIAVALALNDRFGNAILSPETAEFGDYLLLSIFAVAISLGLSILLGTLFSFSNNRE
ncbi:MAG: J domain-containing protein [Pirellulaceae bacterium]|nr:J domain-containing protein [Pirellulaceae bacterium]